MIQNKFIKDIVDYIVKETESIFHLSRQTPFLTENEFSYTGVGLFVSFSLDCNKTDYLTDITVNLFGARIVSPNLPLGATAHIFLESGIIRYLEILANSGEFPQKEIVNYRLEPF